MTIRPNAHPFRRAIAAAGLVAATGAGILAALPGAAQAGTLPSTSSSAIWQFSTHDDPADPTFNQLLGVNDHGTIAGYFGSGTPAAIHPNKGYTLKIRKGANVYKNENFPGSAQTQVTAINDHGVTVGFYVDASGNTFGFVKHGGRYTTVANPASPDNNQLLGVNNEGMAVGVYIDAAGNTHGYRYNLRTKHFTPVSVNIPGAVSVQATGINDRGDISGFVVDAAGDQTAFLLTRHHLTTIEATGSSMTQAFGINDRDQVVGQYIDGAQVTHGFVWSDGHLTTVDNPNANGMTTVNGLNNRGEIVGFYLDAAGNTDGFVAVTS